ncbi:genetic exchange protein, putative [Parvularcula bermudensis HTCC2503]|uniref:Genetic exchange protein, putative n=1 Tax=Parvularcula bermudensis (strain ATCC BAA-594 / HTCC2503 / KCTC 12087) TaxID=314260 RepID=E0TH84_PARBH|nr:phage portal protein [Parvularcula bermudensis]ADM09668.1 genetic exchange protein, putative [Parvularcula bermudensis HTCC2503]
MRLFSRKPTAEATDHKSLGVPFLMNADWGASPRWSGRSGANLAKAGYGQNPVVYRCTQIIAEAAASVPLMVRCDHQVVTDDHVVRRLSRPNADQSQEGFFQSIYAYLLLAGNAYIEVVQGAEGPAALWPLPPEAVEIVHTPRGTLDHYRHRTGGQGRRLAPAVNGAGGVLHIKTANTDGSPKGVAPIAVAAKAIDLYEAATAWNKSLLDNAARPSGALIHRGPEGAATLTAAQFERLKQELAATYQGPGGVGRPMLLDGGLEWKPMSLSPSEMDFKELKHGAARDIALAFGVPPMLLGIPGDNTYANYREANLAFWRQTILPLVKKVVADLSVIFCREEVSITPDTENIDALFQSRVDRLTLLLETDVLTNAEKRALLGYPSDEQAS